MIDREVSNTFDRRSALFLGFGVVLTSILILRMLQLQMFNYKTYKKKSENNAIRVQVRLPMRGRIMTSDMAPMARDVPIYRAYIIPSEADNLDRLLNMTKSELKLPDKEFKKLNEKIEKQRSFQAVMIRESLDWNQLANLQAMGLSGLHIEQGFARKYPFSEAASHIVGYVSHADNAPRSNQDLAAKSPFFETGITGLEKNQDEKLAGFAGRSVQMVDAIGRITGEDPDMEKTAVDGKDVTTTILDIAQRKLYSALDSSKSACGVVMEAATGNILAMVSKPGFDPEKFRSDSGPEYTKGLREDPLRPFMNRTIEGLYPPGSTFKIVVALAALEAGAVTPTEKIFCPGYWDYGDHRYNCWEKKGHGWENLSEAIKHSCDVYFYQIAMRIGIDAIKNMALKLGFGEKLLNVFPLEAAGIIPDRKWKESHVGGRWYHGDTIISGIGQGFILANCLQLATMMARVSTNRIIMPKLIIEDKKQNQPDKLGLHAQNLRYVLAGLESVTQEGGTAAWAAINVNGMHMGGKTGTSQVRSITSAEREAGVRTNDQLPWHLRNHGLFVGYAPTTEPKYVIAVITEHSGGSGQAAYAAANVMRELLKNKKEIQ